MENLPPQDYLIWAQRLANLDWPLTAEQFTRITAEFGWSPNVVSNSFITTLPFPSSRAAIDPDFKGRITRVDLNLTEVIHDGRAEWEVNDLFVDYYEATVRTLGQPVRLVPGTGYRDSWWPLPNRALLTLGASKTAVSFTVYPPDGRAFLDWE